MHSFKVVWLICNQIDWTVFICAFELLSLQLTSLICLLSTVYTKVSHHDIESLQIQTQHIVVLWWTYHFWFDWLEVFVLLAQLSFDFGQHLLMKPIDVRHLWVLLHFELIILYQWIIGWLPQKKKKLVFWT